MSHGTLIPARVLRFRQGLNLAKSAIYLPSTGDGPVVYLAGARRGKTPLATRRACSLLRAVTG
jgi:superfamily I DNA/RNA helicase